MTTLAETSLPARTPGTVTRRDAMVFHATGRTAPVLRARACDPLVTEGIAILAGVSPEAIAAEMHAIADGIDAIAAEGLTPEKCWFLLGLDAVLGPVPGNDPAVPR